jgi:hypothetical protein
MSSQWIAVATFEVDSFTVLPESLHDPSGQFEVRAAAASPTGFVWYDILVDETLGAQRRMLVTFDALRRLREAHQCGSVLYYRLIAGAEYSRVTRSVDALDRAPNQDGDAPPGACYG